MSVGAVRFDDAIPRLASYLVEEAHLDPSSGVFLRDGFGHVAFFSSEDVTKKSLRTHQRALLKLMGGAAFPGGALLDKSSPGAAVLSEAQRRTEQVTIDGNTFPVSVVDRRFFGRDWLLTPKSMNKELPPMLVFCSLKGGVGRTTALFVLAMSLARQGANILCVDLDIEAPGLASLMFEGPERPKYGVIDYLVETSLSGIKDSDLSEFVGTSILTDRDVGQGRVDLMPATGTVTVNCPKNMISKLSRALLEETGSDGTNRQLSQQLNDMIKRVAARSQYDVILVDARAGFSELTAGPLLGLGGHVLLFATDHPHTFEGYRYLMAHLSTLPVADLADDWRERINFVHAMSPSSAREAGKFEDKLYEMLASTFYEVDLGEESFTFSLDDPNGTHKAWEILFDPRYQGLNPIADRSVLDSVVYRNTFGTFLDRAVDVMGLPFKGDVEVGTV